MQLIILFLLQNVSLLNAFQTKQVNAIPHGGLVLSPGVFIIG
jgi:hypothetical protein